MISRNVIRDPFIPAESKGIYAYLAGFAGDSDECYPSVSRICEEMAMTKTSLYKYMNILVGLGIVERIHTRNGNLKGKVIYKITDSNYNRCPNSSYSVDSESLVSENMRIRDIRNPSDVETNNNSINNNSINNNSSINVCPESKAPDRFPVILLILNDKTEHPVYQEDIDEWKEIYPSVDIIQELRKMKGWLDANPTKRKTKRGIKRFINGWLSREQDKGGRSTDKKNDSPKEEPYSDWKPDYHFEYEVPPEGDIFGKP